MQRCEAQNFQTAGSLTENHSFAWEQLKVWFQKETLVIAALVVVAAFFVGGLGYTFYNAFQTYRVF